MDQRGINVHGRRLRKGTSVTINHEMFRKCIQTIRTMKREILIVKETNMRGLGIEFLDHSEEEANDQINASEAKEEDDLGEKLLKSLFELKGMCKIEVSTYSRILNPKELIDRVREMEKYFDME